VEPEPGIEVKEVPGGLYAVTMCKLIDDPGGTVAQVWMALWEWVQEGEYSWRETHELEKHLQPDASLEEMVLELYLPIQQ
jgi:predicted transcriptional regulator YdeE